MAGHCIVRYESARTLGVLDADAQKEPFNVNTRLVQYNVQQYLSCRGSVTRACISRWKNPRLRVL